MITLLILVSQHLPFDDLGISQPRRKIWADAAVNEWVAVSKDLPCTPVLRSSQVRTECESHFPEVSELDIEHCQDNMFSSYLQTITNRLKAANFLNEGWKVALLREDSSIEALGMLHEHISTCVYTLSMCAQELECDADIIMATCRAKLKSKIKAARDQHRLTTQGGATICP